MRTRLLAAATAATVLLSACTGTPAPGPSATPTPGLTATVGPGSDGIGDRYFPQDGNGGYDVASYDLDVAYVPASGVLTGTAVITATATQGLTRFNLDLHGFDIASVTVGDAPATPERSGDELVITPPATIAAGTSFVVKIKYSGVPKPYTEDGEEVGFLKTTDGAIAIGEPDVAASWYPVNDHPRDKATYTIKITAPTGLTSLSNGVRTSSTTAGGQTTTAWSVTKPMASYLATMVIGKFRLRETNHNGLPMLVAVDQSLPTTVDDQLARTGEIADFLQKSFGPYPFDALGGIVVNDHRIGFALENQTRPIYTSGFFTNREGTPVIAHELGHQWYGDSVSVDTWREIWLNEGFATYAEWMWTEKITGRTVQSTFDRFYQQAESPIWSVPPGDPGAARLFSASVYNRGGMTLHALRTTVGDEKFFTILKSWAAEKAGSTGTSQQFIELAERISGQQLDQLFDAWLYQPVRPAKP